MDGPINGSRHPARVAGVHSETVGDELLILHIASGLLHQLNPTARWIYDACDGQTSIDTLLEAMIAAFGVDREAAERDLLSTLQQLRDKQLISY